MRKDSSKNSQPAYSGETDQPNSPVTPEENESQLSLLELRLQKLEQDDKVGIRTLILGVTETSKAAIESIKFNFEIVAWITGVLVTIFAATGLSVFKRSIPPLEQTQEKNRSEIADSKENIYKLQKRIEFFAQELEMVEQRGHRNSYAVGLISTANAQIINYMQSAPKQDSLLNHVIGQVSQVVDGIQPTDQNILGWAYQLYGLCLYFKEQYDEALEKMIISLDHNPNNSLTLYNAACTASRLGKIKEALEYLQKAINLNESIREQAIYDPDFENLRNEPGFPKQK